MRHDPNPDPLAGVLIASGMVLVWMLSLGLLLAVDLGQRQWLWVLPAVLGRTYSQTGLFILAHDAIHGVIAPGDRRLNLYRLRFHASVVAWPSGWPPERFPSILLDTNSGGTRTNHQNRLIPHPFTELRRKTRRCLMGA